MSATDGAGSQSGGDPVLEGALSEMVADGSVDLASNFDPGPEPASQPTGEVSAAPAATAPAPAGDDGSVKHTAPSPTPTAPAVDPLAGTEPFTYGPEGKTLSGVYRVPGEGLLVPEDQVASVQQLAERADVLDRVSREVTAQNSILERLSQWTVTNPDGTEQQLTGQHGLEAMRADYARMEASLAIAEGILSDPAKILSLIGKDGQGNIVLDPDALDRIADKVRLAQHGAEQQARSQFASLGRPATPTAAASGTRDFSQAAPPLIKQAAGANYSALTAEDQTLLAKQISRYIRPVTDEDRRFNPALKLGGDIVDAEYERVVQHLASQRAASSKAAKAAEIAGAHNAGMDKGRQPAKQPPKPVTPPVKPDERKKDKADWEGPLNSALTEMGISR